MADGGDVVLDRSHIRNALPNLERRLEAHYLDEKITAQEYLALAGAEASSILFDLDLLENLRALVLERPQLTDIGSLHFDREIVLHKLHDYLLTLAGELKDHYKIFIGGISWETTEKRLRDYFSRYGEVVQTVIMQDRLTGRARGFGFVVFSDPSMVDIALQGKYIIDGRVDVDRLLIYLIVPEHLRDNCVGLYNLKFLDAGLTDQRFVLELLVKARDAAGLGSEGFHSRLVLEIKEGGLHDADLLSPSMDWPNLCRSGLDLTDLANTREHAEPRQHIDDNKYISSIGYVDLDLQMEERPYMRSDLEDRL